MSGDVTATAGAAADANVHTFRPIALRAVTIDSAKVRGRQSLRVHLLRHVRHVGRFQIWWVLLV
jgi:hypothetical protein